MKLVLQNLRVEGKEVRYEAIKPFDTIIDYADRQSWLGWLNLVRTFFIKQITTPTLDSDSSYAFLRQMNDDDIQPQAEVYI